MSQNERAMLIYLKLAEISQVRNQLPGRDRFLILAACEAAHAGCLSFANRCQQLVLEHNPFHLLRHYDNMHEALNDPDFQPLRNSLERICGLEKAEYLLELNHIEFDSPLWEDERSQEELAESLLQSMEANGDSP